MPSALDKHLYLFCQGVKLNDDESTLDETEEEEIISELVNEGADINFQYKGSNPICEVSRRGNIGIATALIKYGVDLNNTDKYKCSALYLAASHGHFELCKILLQAGADLNQRNKFAYTPLLSAVENSHIKLTKFLVQEGAQVNLRTPVSYRSRFAKTLFEYFAFQSCNADVMKDLAIILLRAGVIPLKFEQIPTHWILFMDQIERSLLIKMLKLGFSLHFKETINYLERERDQSESSEEDEELIEDLRFHTFNVHSLQEIARNHIRESLVLSKERMHLDKKIESLDIPKSLISYLKLIDIL